jgi:CheY-like chemotaxis protein
MPSVKILVVEDEQLVADDLSETLSSLGYEVSALASSAEEAIHHVEQLSPDVVLMDIRLPGAMDGVEAAAEIQSRFRVPVIYLTANADYVTLERVKATHP